MLSLPPVKKLSMHNTSCPSLNKRSHKCNPGNNMKIRLLFAAIVCLANAGALGAPISKTTAPPKSIAKIGGTIRIALKADIRGTEVGVNRDTNTDTVMMHVVEGLVAYGE